MHEWWPIASKVLAVFAVMAAGVLARQVGWLTREADHSLMRLTVNVLFPCFFFHRVVADPQLSRLVEVSLPPLAGFVTTLLGFLAAGVAARLLWGPLRLPSASHRRAFTLCTGMYNYGYIPLPIALVFFPGAVTTLIVWNVGVEVAFWTVGLLIISGSLGRDWWRRILNPPVLAITAAVLVNVSGTGRFVPQLALDAADMLGACGIPMGLVLSGAVIYDLATEFDGLAHWQTFVGSALIRLVLLPVAFLLLARHLPMSMELRQVFLLQAAMPAASFPIVVTRLYGQDTPTAFRVVVGTTLASVLTIPLWLTAGSWYLGIEVMRPR